MSLSVQPYKGARDFYPEEKRLQDYMFDKMRQVVKSYGYQEYDAPLLEPLELYKAKTGDEIVNEQTYFFEDRGGREVAIRPEMTPTVSRMVAGRRQELAYPLRWFSIPNLWRYERPQRGRLREHWQLNVDIFGEEDIAADHEVICIADRLLKSFGATPSMYAIKINSRKLSDAMMKDYLGLSEQKAHDLSKLLDKMHKLESGKFNQMLETLCEGMENGLSEKITGLLQINTLDELPDMLAQHESVGEMRRLLELLENSNISNAAFDITLMRGFDYYTDIVFEVGDASPDNNRSMFGGGRYDGLVGMFGVEPVPTVGFGMGDVTLANFLTIHGLMPEIKCETDMLIVTIGDVYPDVSRLAEKFREMGLNVAVDATNRKLDKKLKSADKQGVRYVLFVGQDELTEDIYPIKDIVTGKEEKHSAERIVTLIQDYRSQ